MICSTIYSIFEFLLPPPALLEFTLAWTLWAQFATGLNPQS